MPEKNEIVHFEIPANNPERLADFYKKLFGWKFKKIKGAQDYWVVDPSVGLSGGITQRDIYEHKATNYILVDSIDKMIDKVMNLGGKVIVPKTAVLGSGYFAVCLDADDNSFGMWQEDKDAK